MNKLVKNVEYFLFKNKVFNTIIKLFIEKLLTFYQQNIIFIPKLVCERTPS